MSDSSSVLNQQRCTRYQGGKTRFVWKPMTGFCNQLLNIIDFFVRLQWLTDSNKDNITLHGIRVGYTCPPHSWLRYKAAAGVPAVGHLMEGPVNGYHCQCFLTVAEL